MLSPSQVAFAQRVVRRKQLFKGLSIAGVVGAVAILIYAAIRRSHDPGFEVGPRLVIAVFILLNSRQNLRQYRVAGILEDLGAGKEPSRDGSAGAAAQTLASPVPPAADRT